MNPEQRFYCRRHQSVLSVRACVEQQRLPAVYSACQDCPLGRVHQKALLTPVSGRLVLPTVHAAHCLICGQPTVRYGLCRAHYDQHHRRGRVSLPGQVCSACETEPAQANGLCQSCTRARPGAGHSRAVQLWGSQLLVNDRLYTVTELRLWGRGQLLHASPQQLIVYTPMGLLIHEGQYDV